MWTMPPLPATINGIEIRVEEMTDELGRAVTLHSYPRVDLADIEDNGATPTTFRITGFVFGPNWLGDADLLKDNCRWGGEDVLVHPLCGTFRGKVTGVRVIHRDVEHDMARVSIDFVEGRVATQAFTSFTSPSSAAAAVRVAGDEATAALAAWP